MVEVDGKKYISEDEFNNAVYKELHDVSGICAQSFLDNPTPESMEMTLGLGNLVAEAYANLHIALFKSKEDKKDE